MSSFILINSDSLSCMKIRHILEAAGHLVIAEGSERRRILLQITFYRPEFLIIGPDIPCMDGLKIIALLREQGSIVRIIVISSLDGEYYAHLSEINGANAFISREKNLNDLTIAIEVIKSGHSYFPLNLYKGKYFNTEEGNIKKLSPRELDVLKCLVKNMTPLEISEKLHITPRVVSTYKSRLRDKLGLKDNADFTKLIRREHVNKR